VTPRSNFWGFPRCRESKKGGQDLKICPPFFCLRLTAIHFHQHRYHNAFSHHELELSKNPCSRRIAAFFYPAKGQWQRQVLAINVQPFRCPVRHGQCDRFLLHSAEKIPPPRPYNRVSLANRDASVCLLTAISAATGPNNSAS